MGSKKSQALTLVPRLSVLALVPGGGADAEKDRVMIFGNIDLGKRVTLKSKLTAG